MATARRNPPPPDVDDEPSIVGHPLGLVIRSALEQGFTEAVTAKDEVFPLKGYDRRLSPKQLGITVYLEETESGELIASQMDAKGFVSHAMPILRCRKQP